MNTTFLKACKGEKVDYTPVWIMRQAGRYLPQYQKLRNKVDFLTLCKTPELAAEVTLQPVDILGVDAAILFSDILIPVEAMGMNLKFYEKKGPILKKPIRTLKDLDRLKIPQIEKDLHFVLDTIKILKKIIKIKVPLIGFSGAPFTLATYMIEGGGTRYFIHTKSIMFSSPKMFHKLMKKITDTIILYLTAQIKTGVNAVQIFDSWAGILAPDDYNIFCVPYIKMIIEAIKPLGVPIIYFINNCGGLLFSIKNISVDVIGIDWRVDIEDVINIIGENQIIQGNLDPCVLFSDIQTLKEKISIILKKAKKAKGHIFNLGHGILPQTPPHMAKALVDIVHELSNNK